MTTPAGPSAPDEWDDPGWGKPHEILLGAFVPQLMAKKVRETGSPLLSTRLLLLSFSSSLVLISLVVLFLSSDTEPTGSPSAAVACAIAAAVATCLVALGRVVKRTLPCGDVGQVLGAYRTRFFLQMAFNNAAAMSGFVLVFLSGVPWPYFVALPIALVGQLLAAPTLHNLEAESRSMAAQGCPTSLLGAFAQVTPPTPTTYGP